MDNFSYQRLKDAIQKADRIAIAVGRDPHVDDMAAALSLYLALSTLGKKPTIASATQPLVEHSSLVGIDKVKSQFDGGTGDLIVSFPYKEGEIEKVSYTIEGGLLNIVVKAGQQGLTFQEQDVRFSRGGGVPNLLFIVGTPRLSDLGNLFNPDTLKDTTIVNIDNKRDNQGFGDIVLVSPQASSVSEEVTSILLAIDSELDVDTAQNLLSGISQATNDFQDPKTSPLAFEMAGVLMKKGARRSNSIPQPQQQNEERVSSFMPEQSLAGTGAGAASSFQRLRSQAQAQPQPQSNAQPQPQVQSQPQPSQAQGQPTQRPSDRPQGRRQQPPSDWLTPKVYKGSSNVQ